MHRILKVAGSDLEPLITNTVRHEIPSMWLACDKARRVLDWKPEVGFDDGLEEAIRWYLAWFRKSA